MKEQTILVTGGTGFIGSALVRVLKDRGYKVLVIARQSKNKDQITLDLEKEAVPVELIERVDVIVHLAGTSLFQLWTSRVKQSIYDSRILSTRHLVEAIAQAKKKPTVLVTASAVGYYGSRGDTDITESTRPAQDFLGKLCIDWESEARKAEAYGVRTVQIRTAPVLGQGGMLKQLLPLYLLGLGGPIGSGQQWFSWIQLQDLVSIYLKAVEDAKLSGPVNASSPQPVRYKDFAQALGKILHRPTFFPTPVFLMKLIFRDFAESMIGSQRVIPRKLLEGGFTFQRPEIEEAIRTSLGK